MSRFVFWPKIWFILVNVSWALEKNVYSTVVGSYWLMVFFCILADFLPSSFISCSVRAVVVSNCNCGFVYFSSQFYQICVVYFEALLLGAYIFRIAISSW